MSNGDEGAISFCDAPTELVHRSYEQRSWPVAAVSPKRAAGEWHGVDAIETIGPTCVCSTQEPQPGIRARPKPGAILTVKMCSAIDEKKEGLEADLNKKLHPFMQHPGAIATGRQWFIGFPGRFARRNDGRVEKGPLLRVES